MLFRTSEKADHSLFLQLKSNIDFFYLFRFCVRFVVWQLERGMRKYGVGTTCQLYIIVDRSPLVQSKENFFGSPSATQNLPIMKSIFITVQVNRPGVSGFTELKHLCGIIIVLSSLLTLFFLLSNISVFF